MLENQGDISKDNLSEIKKVVENIVEHPKLSNYFNEDVLVFNEREIISLDGEIIIPDRLVYENGALIIIDYKTGKQEENHRQQLYKYESILKDIGYKIHKKMLVYINENCCMEVLS